MKVVDINALLKIIRSIGLESFYLQLIGTLQNDYSRWSEFKKTPRHTTHYPQGVIELMPISDHELYSFKYVNGHPSNTQQNKLCVVATGMLCDAHNGYPLMISEMTLLTALRTAATGALAGKYLARKNSHKLAIIGTGAQAEFQVLAFASLFPLQTISYYDIDPLAMQKFAANLSSQNFQLQPCSHISQCVNNADIVVTATAAKQQVELFQLQDLKAGCHIHAMGGDCPGKTELGQDILNSSKVIVEYLPQSLIEGEIQQGGESMVYAELWELINQQKPARVNDQEYTLFDSVGFALEDYSILKLVYQLSERLQLGEKINLIPQLNNPKDLYHLLNSP